MVRRVLRRVLALLLIATGAQAQDAGADASRVPPASLNERLIRVPGDPDRPVTLEVTLFTPAGAGPFPLAVMNHGATQVSKTDRGQRYRYTFSAYYFLSRGYAVALPMARGFAQSGGDLVHDGCNLDGVGLANARDLRAAIAAIARQPGVDASRVVVAGQSFGGWTTLALGTMDVPGVHGIVAFSPALRASDCAQQDLAMVASARSFGAHARLPSLWFYGDNDSVMPVPTWRAVFDAYARGNGRAALVAVGRFMADSHQLLSYPESLPIWAPQVDKFLARIGLPSSETNPQYLPIPRPPPSHTAAVENVAAVPFLNDKGREAYRAFLARPFPRVFAIAPSGTASTAFGGFDPLARALSGCQKAGVMCRPYAIDADVVWPVAADMPQAATRAVSVGRSQR